MRFTESATPPFDDLVDNEGPPSIIDGLNASGQTETICWADVDFDGDLDLFVPEYGGNFFYTNQGSAENFTLKQMEVGLDHQGDFTNPEGAQFVDYDFDGDLDNYFSSRLFQNISSPGQPLFEALLPDTGPLGSGIVSSVTQDEGVVFFDFDLDGDFDVCVVGRDVTAKIWGNRGDGTFREVTGIGLRTLILVGGSAVDWDNDGDIDLTTAELFYENQLIAEQSSLTFSNIPSESHLIMEKHLGTRSKADKTGNTPAWVDWDKDGDLDCVLGGYNIDEEVAPVGGFYVNTLYEGSVPDPTARKFVRIRPVNEDGNETEYGAVAEIYIHDEDPLATGSVARHRSFTVSSAGYLNQGPRQNVWVVQTPSDAQWTACASRRPQISQSGGALFPAPPPHPLRHPTPAFRR